MDTDAIDVWPLSEKHKHLIEAAADMHAALGPCIKQLRLWMKDHGQDLASEEAIANAVAAIALAEGRSK
jgi:hypothetical protein